MYACLKVFFIILAFFPFVFCVHAETKNREFSQFVVNLPDGWDGEEQKGFVSGDEEEYQLSLGRMDEAKDEFLAQVSIYMLPNKNGVTSKEAALQLAEAQGGSSEPIEEGNFLVFRGEPRSKLIKGVATTMVNVNPQRMLIIIAQDPANLGSREVIKSLRGVTPEAQQMLGR